LEIVRPQSVAQRQSRQFSRGDLREVRLIAGGIRQSGVRPIYGEILLGLSSEYSDSISEQ